MANIDMCLAANGATLADSADGYINDNNWLTACGRYLFVNPSGSDAANYSILTRDCTIQSIEWGTYNNNNLSGPTGGANTYLYVTSNGVETLRDAYPYSWSDRNYVNRRTINITLTHVTKIRVYMTCWTSLGLERVWCHDVQAWGFVPSKATQVIII
jgi:hypothetical protein